MVKKRIQFTLTVEQAKELIVIAVSKHSVFKQAVKAGKILFKGGTTVSRLTELLYDYPLRISGRITARGTTAAAKKSNLPHSILVEKGNIVSIDPEILTISQTLGPDDLVICGANAIDARGQAALMAGSSGGGKAGRSIVYWRNRNVNCLITAGLEKLIPGNLRQLTDQINRENIDLAWGMAVGLILLPGHLITELEAVKLLAEVNCYAIGAGGIGSAAGSSVLEGYGDKKEIDKLINILKNLKSHSNQPAGLPDSLVECRPGSPDCADHLSCGYLKNRF